MIKFIILVFVVMGWFAGSKAFIPGVWNPSSWCVPFTAFPISWGLVVLVGLVFLTHRAVK